MPRPIVCLSLLALAAVAAPTRDVPAAERQTPSPPNVMVILCDDLGYGDLSCYGHPAIETPNLDRLASQGWRMTSFYAAAPVCSSSRAGLITGVSPSRLGIYDWIPEGHPMHVTDETVTIPERLKTAGYQTCHVGKWHLTGLFNKPGQPQPGDQGFDHWYSTQNNAGPSHEDPVNFVRNGTRVGPQEGFSCQLVADEAIRWLDARDPAKPFFQWVCFHEPHEPVASPPDLVAKYRDRAKEEDQAQYFANVANVDAAVGRLMAALDRLGVAGETFVVFTSDNGPETLDRYKSANRSWGSPGPLRGMKLHVYEGGIRVPGIFRFPGRLEAGRVVEAPVSALDLMPTFCRLADVAPPEGVTLDGVDLVPAFGGGPVTRPRPLFWYYGHSLGGARLALRDGDRMLIGHTDRGPTGGGSPYRAGDAATMRASVITSMELYDLSEDLAQASPRPAPDDLARTMAERFREVQDGAIEWFEGVAPAK